MSKLASIGFLTEDQRLKFNQFPESIEQDHLIQYFLLSNPDLKIIPVRSPAYSRLGFALSLCALRFLGFIPEELITVPITAMSFLLKQLNLASVPEDFAQYGSRLQTKSDHTLTIENYLGFKRFTEDYQRILTDWLLVLAMEHDGKMLLLNAATEKLQWHALPPTLLLWMLALGWMLKRVTRRNTLWRRVRHALREQNVPAPI